MCQSGLCSTALDSILEDYVAGRSQHADLLSFVTWLASPGKHGIYCSRLVRPPGGSIHICYLPPWPASLFNLRRAAKCTVVGSQCMSHSLLARSAGLLPSGLVLYAFNT